MVVRIVLILFCLMGFEAIAQDRLNFINGKSIDCMVDSVGRSNIYCIWKKGKKKNGRSMIYHRSEVYSITNEKDEEDIVFLEDTITGYGYSIEGIKVYRQGCVDARENLNVNLFKYLGFGLGLGFVSWETNWFQEDAGTINVVFPIAYTLAVGVWKPRPRKNVDRDLVQNPAYLMAYQKVGQGRKIAAALKGSFAGVLVGVIGAGVKKLAEK